MPIGYETSGAAIARARELNASPERHPAWRMTYRMEGRWFLSQHIGITEAEPQEARYVSPEGEVFKLVPDLPLTHIEDLWEAAEKYRRAQVRAILSVPANFEPNVAEARAKFMEWCRLRGLPIDFTPR